MGYLNSIGIICVFFLNTELCGCFILETDHMDNHGSSTYLCRYIMDFNCTNFSTGTLCGSDGVTYGNHCAFSKSVCQKKSLHIRHPGPCRTEKEEQELVLSLTCTDLLNMECNSFLGTTTYCGTNAVTYTNVCHFEKARCSIKHLYLDHVGRC